MLTLVFKYPLPQAHSDKRAASARYSRPCQCDGYPARTAFEECPAGCIGIGQCHEHSYPPYLISNGIEANDPAAINHTVRHLFQNFLWILHMHKKGMTNCQIILLVHIGLLNIAFNKLCIVRERFEDFSGWLINFCPLSRPVYVVPLGSSGRSLSPRYPYPQPKSIIRTGRSILHTVLTKKLR